MIMKLIDAGKLLDELNERKTPYDAEINEIIVSQKVYDIDKVVEQLEEWTFNADVNLGDGTVKNSDLIASENAIEIVKRGIISDDVCEWKSTSNREFIQNPHTKRLYSNEPSMKNVYCNTCGKKIKVVQKNDKPGSD